MTNLRGGKALALTAAAAAAFFAAGCATPTSTTMAMESRATGSPPAVKPAKPVSAPTARHTAAAAPPSRTAAAAPPTSTGVQAAVPQAPAPAPQSGPGLSDTTPASSTTPAPPPSTLQPPPCAFGACIPWVWYKATAVINNNALLPIPAFGASMDNNTPKSSTLTDTATGSITVGAQLGGKIGSGGPSAAGIASAIGEIDPQVSASVTVTTTKTVNIQVPHDYQGVITFGVPAVEVKGYVYTRDMFGHVTRIPMNAWAPVYPTIFGFNAYVTPLAGSGPKSEIPVIPIPAG